MEESQVRRAERTSSMENEPRTLNFHQIHFAREAALYVVNTRSIEEAMSIFTQGMERGEESCNFSKKKECNELEKDEEDMIAAAGVSRNTRNIFRLSSIRDIATAPF